MKNYLPILLAMGLMAVLILTDKKDTTETKIIAAMNETELRVAPVAPDDMILTTTKDAVPDDSGEVILKCQKVSTPKAYELLPVNGNE